MQGTALLRKRVAASCMRVLKVVALHRLLFGAVACTSPAIAMSADNTMAVRPKTFYSSDADGSEVWKTSLGWDWTRRDREHWLGIDVEYAKFSGNDWSHQERRGYAHAAGTFGAAKISDDTWRWQGRMGSNGHTVLGSASLNTEGPQRREIFFERELLETRGGTERGQMYNFLGAAIDQPFGARWSGTALAGLQTFSDDNLRTHMRGNLVYAVLPEQGLSAQLRTRYFRNSEAYEGNYYSPDWYAQGLGVVALRRVVRGYTGRMAVGLGRQRSSDEDWKRARLVELGFESPRWRQSSLSFTAGYTDTPVASSTGTTSYSYRYATLDWAIAF